MGPITGDVGAQILPFLWGPGANGKSVLLDVSIQILGDYASAAPPGFLMDKGAYSEHSTELTELHGRRIFVCSELKPNDKLDEARVKHLTGGDKITARRMRQNFYSFAPTHKLWLLGNHRPEVAYTELAKGAESKAADLLPPPARSPQRPRGHLTKPAPQAKPSTPAPSNPKGWAKRLPAPKAKPKAEHRPATLWNAPAASALPLPSLTATNTATSTSPLITWDALATSWAPSSPPCARPPKPAASKPAGSPRSTPSARSGTRRRHLALTPARRAGAAEATRRYDGNIWNHVLVSPESQQRLWATLGMTFSDKNRGAEFWKRAGTCPRPSRALVDSEQVITASPKPPPRTSLSADATETDYSRGPNT